MAPNATPSKPKATHCNVSLYPHHFKMLDEMQARLNISRSRLVQYLIELEYENLNHKGELPDA